MNFLSRNRVIIVLYSLTFFFSEQMLGNVTAMDPLDRLSSGEHMKAVRAYGDSKPKRILILGVRNGVDGRGLERFSEDCIFLDVMQDNPEDNRSLEANFNSLNQLMTLAEEFKGYFDKIILDGATFRFTNWTPEHLKLFKKMLKQNGDFIYGPYAEFQARNFGEAPNLDDALKMAKESTNLCTEQNVLCTKYAGYYILPTGSLTRDELETYAQEARVEYDDYADIENQTFDDFLALYLAPKVRLKLYRNLLLPYLISENYQKLTEEAFGAGNVKVERDQDLPFRPGDVQGVVITATKRD